jgi:hypothetical protein
MTENIAQQVAEAIFNAAQSGSAVWDELGGPYAVLRRYGNRYVIAIPGGDLSDHVCLITVECGEQ